MSGNQLVLAGAPGAVANYIEDVFSTYLYTGTGTTQTITNGIDLSTNGGLTWFKLRGTAENHVLIDSARGIGQKLYSNSTAAQATATNFISSYNTTGFTIGNTANPEINSSNANYNYVSWTFREQPKFFDIVTYTGNGTNGRAISHALASSPGCVIIKSLNNSGTGYDGWYVRHRSATGLLYLNLTNAQEADFGSNITALSSTTVTVGGDCNENGETYVMYLFAHDAGGFGLTGSDNVISCGSLTTGSSGYTSVNLGYEPQWVMVKTSAVAGSWIIVDNMRGFPVTGNSPSLSANNSNAEDTARDNSLRPTATGFDINADFYGSSRAFIYIAIRRGPMKIPTSGTSVYFPNTRTGTGATATVTGVGFPPDLVWTDTRSAAEGAYMFDKLRGPLLGLRNFGTDAEVSDPQYLQIFGQNGFTYGTNGSVNQNTRTYIDWCMRRAPGFFDEVCYTGNATARTISHNLGAVPELMIVKSRSSSSYVWAVYNSSVGATKYLRFNSNVNAATESNIWNDTAPTSSVFTVGTGATTNDSGGNYVAYLFASVSGVSKVGSYTGTGALQTVNCGFTGGARFVMIKRTDSTGDWWVYDSARGITSGNDPYLFLNSATAEVTGTNYVDTDTTGFNVTAAAPAGLNANGGTYIFLAIA